MEGGGFLLWLAWAGFGTLFGWVLWQKYAPLVIETPPIPKEPARAEPAWLFCEDGTALDRRVKWFGLNPGGRTVIGSRPRAATEDTAYIYLTADDIQEDHAVVRFDPATGRYEVQCPDGGLVLHNNERLEAGERAGLADGDTLDLGRISRFRFTLTGPEAS